jgi:hypothetical protein
MKSGSRVIKKSDLKFVIEDRIRALTTSAECKLFILRTGSKRLVNVQFDKVNY